MELIDTRLTGQVQARFSVRALPPWPSGRMYRPYITIE